MIDGTIDLEQMADGLLRLARVSGSDIDAEALHRYFEEIAEATALLDSDTSTAVSVAFHANPYVAS